MPDEPALSRRVDLALGGAGHSLSSRADEGRGRRARQTSAHDHPLRSHLAERSRRARWFLFPAWLGEPVGKGGVTGVEVFSTGNAVVGRFLGTGAFQAVYLPARAQLRLENFPIKSYREAGAPAPKSFDVVIAKTLTVGGKPAESWYGGASTASAKRGSADLKLAKRAGSSSTPDPSEVAVEVVEDGRVAIPLGR